MKRVAGEIQRAFLILRRLSDLSESINRNDESSCESGAERRLAMCEERAWNSTVHRFCSGGNSDGWATVRWGGWACVTPSVYSADSSFALTTVGANPVLARSGAIGGFWHKASKLGTIRPRVPTIEVFIMIIPVLLTHGLTDFAVATLRWIGSSLNAGWLTARRPNGAQRRLVIDYSMYALR